MSVLQPSQIHQLNLLPSGLHVYQLPFRRGTLNPGPLDLPPETRLRQISTGFFFALCVDDEGKLFSFGFNGDFERLGHGPTGEKNVTNPTRVAIPPNVFIVDASAGGNHSLALSSDGVVYSFGADDFYQLGRLDSSPYPMPVPMPDKIRSIHCGWNFSVAVLESPGQIVTWGSGKDGQLGHSHFSTSARQAVVNLSGDILHLATGYSHVAAIVDSTDGLGNARTRAIIWGSAGIALLDPHVIHEVPGLPADEVISVAAGKMFTLFLTRNGIVYAIGSGENGQLGVGDLCGRNNATVVSKLLHHHIVRIAAGTVSAVAVTDDGRFFRWGNDTPYPLEMYLHIPELALCFPFIHTLKMSAGAGDLLLAGAAASSGDSVSIPQRPILEFLSQFCEADSSIFPACYKRTRVSYRCIHKISHISNPSCQECYLLAYTPLLSTTSDHLKNILETSDGLYLDLEKYSKDGVRAFLHMVCCGFMKADTIIEAAQEVVCIGLTFKASDIIKHASEYVQKKLTIRIRPELVLNMLRYDDDIEESQVRTILSKANQGSNSIRVVLRRGYNAFELVGVVDRIVLCAYSKKYQNWLELRSERSVEWMIPIPADTFTNEFLHIAARGMNLWICSPTMEEWIEKFSTECGKSETTARRLCQSLSAVMLASHTAGIESLKAIAESELVMRISSQMPFQMWAGLLRFASHWPKVCPRLLAQLRYIGDKACIEIKRKEEEVIVEELEKEARKTKTSWDAEIARSRRRGLDKWARDKVYCNPHHSVDKILQDVEEVFWGTLKPHAGEIWFLNGNNVRSRKAWRRKLRFIRKNNNI